MYIAELRCNSFQVEALNEWQTFVHDDDFTKKNFAQKTNKSFFKTKFKLFFVNDAAVMFKVQ